MLGFQARKIIYFIFSLQTSTYIKRWVFGYITSCGVGRKCAHHLNKPKPRGLQAKKATKTKVSTRKTPYSR